MVEFTVAGRMPGGLPPVLLLNRDGSSPFVLVCDHASNRIPERHGDLGLTLVQRLMHIAWDPGAIGVARRVSDLLDAPLVQSTVSRLVIDCNRHIAAPDLIPVVSERIEIAANRGISEEERARRIADYHFPFHQTIAELLERRAQDGRETIFVTIHSFTPVYNDVWRPWPIGLIHGIDTGFSDALRRALLADAPELNVGWNEPYSARSGVTLTLEAHGDERGLDASMIEIRHDEILEPGGVALWGDRLARCLVAARAELRQMRGAEPEDATGSRKRVPAGIAPDRATG